VTNAMKQYKKTRPSRKPKLAKKCAAAGNSRGEPLAVYDGQRLLGTFIEDEKLGVVLAWNAERKLLGRFGDAKAAANAISEVARAVEGRKAASAEVLEWLNRPGPEFASGLPDDLVGGGRRR
jgi:hypothetical protein